MQYVIAHYGKLYRNACKNLNEVAYDRVKEFLVNLNEEPELQTIALKKLSISPEMFGAMKRLDFHNYKYVVQDNTLFVAMQYPQGFQELSGTDLVNYVVSRYEQGRLGARTILKSIIAWLKNKVKRIRGVK